MKRNPARSLRWLPGALMIAASILACTLPVGKAAPSPTTPPTLPPTNPPATPTVAPSDTPIPTDTPAATPTPAPDVVYGNISFSFDPSIAASVSGQTNPEVNPGPDVAPWEPAPEYVSLDFNGYSINGTFHNAYINVYPVEAYAALSPSAGEIAANLRQLLDQQPVNPSQIPFLPIWNAAQMMRANIRYLDFGSGRGVRFLTQYGQAAYAINNHSIFYTFQGLTNDNHFYVTAVLPVTHPSLPADDSYVPGGDIEAFMNDFVTYVTQVEQQLSAQPDASFAPDLSKLDAMMQSLRIE